MNGIKKILVGEELEGERLDLFITDHLEGLSRSAIQSLIKQERVYVNGEKVKASYRVNAGDEVYVSVPQPVSFKLQPENLPLPILYQDEDIVIVDKPRGMVVHPAQGNWQGTMVNALLYHVQQLSSVNGELRPGIVHRLDKDTSGLMVVAKNDAAHRHLAHQIREHNMGASI